MKLRKIVSSITLFTALICTLFSIGNVYKMELFGKKIIADQNASPFGVYIRKEDVEFINDQLN